MGLIRNFNNQIATNMKILMVFLTVCLISCQSPKKEENLDRAEAPDMNVEKEMGYILPGLDHGILQSPINIVTKNVTSGEHEIHVHYTSSKEMVSNLGHTVQVNYDEGSSVDYDGHTYYFEQFHFHTPSEHHIDGITYPLEMHMVHQAHVEPDATPLYFVWAILFKEGEQSKFLNEFIDAIPSEEGESIEIASKSVDVSRLVSDHEVEGCYHYAGSLTTPPFTESVHWGIVGKINEASPQQIEKLNRLEGNNARHIQAVYDRVVEQLD